jgi:hypothetical protein
VVKMKDDLSALVAATFMNASGDVDPGGPGAGQGRKRVRGGQRGLHGFPNCRARPIGAPTRTRSK